MGLRILLIGFASAVAFGKNFKETHFKSLVRFTTQQLYRPQRADGLVKFFKHTKPQSGLSQCHEKLLGYFCAERAQFLLAVSARWETILVALGNRGILCRSCKAV